MIDLGPFPLLNGQKWLRNEDLFLFENENRKPKYVMSGLWLNENVFLLLSDNKKASQNKINYFGMY